MVVPTPTRTRRDPDDTNPASRQLDRKEHVERDETTRTPDLDGEEIGGSEDIPVGLEKLTPRRSLASLWGRVDAVLFQDVGDRSPSNSMADVLERALDSCVAPARVLSRHSDRQLRDRLHDSGATWGAPFVSPLLRDELPMPTKNSVGSDERSDFAERPPTDGLSPNGKSSALGVGQSK